MFGRIVIFFSLFFSLFSGVFATDVQKVSGISKTFYVSKNFSINNGILFFGGSDDFFSYNISDTKYNYSLSGITSNVGNFFTDVSVEKAVYKSNNSIITILNTIEGLNYGHIFTWNRVKRDSDESSPPISTTMYEDCLNLFTSPPVGNVCSTFTLPIRFASGAMTEYGVAVYAKSRFYGSKSNYAYFIPDVGSPSYVDGQSPILIDNPVYSISDSEYTPKKSGVFSIFSVATGTNNYNFFLLETKDNFASTYNLTASGINRIQWSGGGVSSDLYAAISSSIPSGFTDSTYCRTTAGYDIISYFDRLTGSGQSFKFYPETGTTTATTDGKICITDLYPDPRGAYVDISDVFGKIAWNGGPLAIIASDSGGYYYATGSQIRYTDTALTGWSSYPASSSSGGGSTDTGYSPSSNGFDCKPVHFSSGSSDGVHIDIPTDEYIYSTGVTTGPTPNSSYSLDYFSNADRSNVVAATVKPFPTGLIKILSGSILGSQSGSFVSFTSSSEYAVLKNTGIPVSGLEFVFRKNGDFSNIVRVVFSTTTDGWNFPIQGSDIIGYAVFFNTATGEYETKNIKKTSSGTGEVRSEKGGQIVQIVGAPGFSFSHVDLYEGSKLTIKKYECKNNAWECYWSRSATGSYSCAGKINPIYGNEIGSCESVGDYCQPSANTSTGKLDPFHYLDASGSIRPVYNQSGSISGIAYNSQADDIFTCSYSGLETLLCVPEILRKIWKRFTVALKNLLDFLYSISSISSPKGEGKILGFVNVASAYDAGATLRLPYYTTSTGAKITKETFTGSKNPMSINSSMATMGENVNNLPDGGIKGIFAFAIYSTILIVLFIVTVMIAVAFSNK